MSTLQSQIEILIHDFTTSLQAIWLRAAQQALGVSPENPLVLHTPTPPTEHADRSRRTRPGAHRPTFPIGVKGQKRPPKEIEQLRHAFVAYIRKNPGLRIEQINKAMGTKTKDLRLPIAHLIAEGRIAADGEKRSTTYRVPAAKR